MKSSNSTILDKLNGNYASLETEFQNIGPYSRTSKIRIQTIPGNFIPCCNYWSFRGRHNLSKDNKYPVKSLIKALNILEHIGTWEHGVGLTEISKKLGIGKSTVHRLLATLIDHDFVWVDPRSSNYMLGSKILQLSGQLNRQSILIRYAEPIISRLTRDTNETCNLGVLDGDEVLYLMLKESDNPLRMSGQVGKRLPAHCTALGKVLLSGLSKQELAGIYGTRTNLETYTSNTVSTIAELEKQLE